LLVEGTFRWQWRVNSFLYLLHDEYPGFTLENEGPLNFNVEYPHKLGRAHLLVRALFGWSYCFIPHAFCLTFRLMAQGVVSFLAWWAILFTGKMPESFFNFTVGSLRWSANLAAYVNFLTDEYPPFSGKEELPISQGVAM